MTIEEILEALTELFTKAGIFDAHIIRKVCNNSIYFIKQQQSEIEHLKLQQPIQVDGNTLGMALELAELKSQQSANELRILGNFIHCMPKVYRQRNINSTVVRDILLNGTSHAGQGSCIDKCRELGVNPDGYDFRRVGDYE